MTLKDIQISLGLLTRLPGGQPGAAGPAAWSFPIIGALVGLLQAAMAAAALSSGASPAVAAGLALLVGVLATGGLHEDGLADTADGLWGGSSIERRLDIMRDSRLGSYGALALMLSLGLQGAALTALITQDQIWAPLIVAGAASRAAMLPVMARVPFARVDGLSRHAGRPSGAHAAIGLGIAFACAVLLVGSGAVGAAISVAVVTYAVAIRAIDKIGGQTGDILGAIQQVSMIAALVALG